ncbi:MAG: hypothetical protein COV07_00735 [Candidatus Vogelbacteria bacterium CG10_big_fil_rev_8_21_14_0_10_45_14]|uniref:Protease PrsW n=1 Tax=Candidatus Vogelbacteria bacterium CG10_big_fil_rev_8_21_14_0_10_45_14 TaxID=1975042 RepID=A0A2H0RM92_9BACT|nr:MAG: hypothetical protein COV07_00735 [Candidatus Vogelbacteria bacterium CG10_big_fil_rev_8_21_14_0_10_45_14]
MAFTQGVEPTIVFFALLGGVFPALLWLFFWLREDKLHPEPRSVLVASFFAGVAVVLLALPAEQKIATIFSAGTFITILLWAATEEVLKFFGACATGMISKAYDEPIDAIVYMITVAIGFATFENTLFILRDLIQNGTDIGILTASMRAIGATLLHVAASAIVGGCIALAYYRHVFVKILTGIVGLILATLLHTLFNQIIIKSNGELTLYVFAGLWVIIVGIILFFEYAKQIKPRTSLPIGF